MASAENIRLDDKMFTAFIDPDIADDPRSRLLTPRLALTHQAGFPNWRGKEKLKFSATRGPATAIPAKVINTWRILQKKRPASAFESLADRYLLQPDHLQNTSFVGQPWFDGRVATPTGADGNALKPNLAKHFIAADLVYTTDGDYARFMLSVLQDEGLTRKIAADRDSCPVK